MMAGWARERVGVGDLAGHHVAHCRGGAADGESRDIIGSWSRDRGLTNGSAQGLTRAFN